MSDQRPIRFLVSDVDGTLVTPDKTVTPAARDAVRALRDADIGFAFVSSRPPKGLASIAQALSLASGTDAGRPAAAAFNGGALLDARLQPLSFTPLADADARVALDVLAAMHIDTWVFTLDDWLIVNPDGRYVAHEQKTVGFAPRVVERFDGVVGIGKIVGSSEDPALLERAGIAISQRLSTNARALLSQAYYLDITHAEANKGSAVRAIAAHAGLALDEIAAIGDMTNDLAMLEIAGFSIAMGNAPDAVKAAVDAVTASNREDGFAKAVRELVLPRASTMAAATGGESKMSTSDESQTDIAKPRKLRHAVEVVPDAESVATRAAEWLIEQIAHAIARRGRAVVALSGGSTPRALYERLAKHPWCDRIQWDLLHVFWGDERFVAADDEASNARMVREALLDRVDIPASHVYAIPLDETAVGEHDANVNAAFARAQAAASLYETTLHAFYGGARLGDSKPFFDVVLLGLGEDGHTASLFPGTDALDERGHWVAAVRTDDTNSSATAPIRITLTYPILESTHAVAFLVTGEAKRDIARRVLDGDETLPAARVHAIGGTLWIMDEAASIAKHR